MREKSICREEKTMATKMSFSARSVIALMMIVGWLSLSPNRMAAQGSQGQKAVWQSSTNLVGSAVWVDASAWWTNPLTVPDLCLYLQHILTSGYGSTSYP